MTQPSISENLGIKCVIHIKRFSRKCIIFTSERLCFDPPAPPYNGGQSDWNKNAYEGTRTPFGTVVTYTCGLGRKLAKYMNDGSRLLYDSKTFRCEWNRIWTPAEAVWLLKITKMPI